MVAPVVLITTGVLMANGIMSTYTVMIDRIRTLKREGELVLAPGT
jgi:hypothetical protein